MISVKNGEEGVSLMLTFTDKEDRKVYYMLVLAYICLGGNNTSLVVSQLQIEQKWLANLY